MAEYRIEASVRKIFIKMQWDEYLKDERQQGVYKNWIWYVITLPSCLNNIFKSGFMFASNWLHLTGSLSMKISILHAVNFTQKYLGI